MSCGNVCPCQFNWPLDTNNGFRKDTISSEKAWLDFAVRYLSREAAGKGNGQETVWSVQCKPSWWDSTVKLPWKNPTTNPKDNKDILFQKYVALEEHLRSENRFPSDLEEEAKLWASKKYKELFLLCDLTCLLKKVSGVHLAIEEACEKADKMKAHINKDVLRNIRNCLNAALGATDKFRPKESSKQLKRPCNDNVQAIPSKKSKHGHEVEKHLVPILPKPEPKSHTNSLTSNISPNLTINANKPKTESILNFANRILKKRKASAQQGSSNLTLNRMKSLLTSRERNETPAFNGNHILTEERNIVMGDCNASSETMSSNPSESFAIDYNKGPAETCTVIPNLSPSDAPLNFDNGIDYLLSPVVSEEKPTLEVSSSFEIGNNIDFLKASSDAILKQVIPIEKEMAVGQAPEYVPSNAEFCPFTNIDIYDPHDINIATGDSPHLIESNNSSPHSAVSEVHSSPVTNSDGGYISADDVNFDIEEFIMESPENVSGSYSLDRFLFENNDEFTICPEISLLDLLDENCNMTNS